MRFAGMTAVVTGGPNGIGAATARRLAADGARVVVVDFDEGSAQATAADVTRHVIDVRGPLNPFMEISRTPRSKERSE